MDDHDQQEQALDQVIPGVTPGALLDAMENPDDFAKIARADLYVHMAHMRQITRNPEFPHTARIEYGKFLAKMGKVENPAAENNPLNGLPLIEIDLGAGGGSVRIGPVHTQQLQPREELDITPDDEEEESPFSGKAGSKQSVAIMP